MHVSEQPAEIDACRAEYGMTPFEFLDDLDLLTPDFTAIHAIHLHPGEVERMARGKITVGACPTTERNLGDGILCADTLIDARCFDRVRHRQPHANRCTGTSSRARIEPAADSSATRCARWPARENHCLDCCSTSPLPPVLDRFIWMPEPSPRASRLIFLPSTFPRHRSPAAFPEELLTNMVFSMSPRGIRDVVVAGKEGHRARAARYATGNYRGLPSRTETPWSGAVIAPQEILRQLVAIPSVSSLSNRPMIECIMQFFAPFGWHHRLFRYEDAAGVEKLNLIVSPQTFSEATIQCRTRYRLPYRHRSFSDAWPEATTLIERDGMLHGCGACDVKGFLSCMIAAASDLEVAQLSKRLCMVFTSDEEIGCRGARFLVDQQALKPRYAIVGEPTSLVPSRAGKGYCLAAISVHGKAAHSAYPSVGHSAIFAAAKLIVEIELLGVELATHRNDTFDPPYTTLNIGEIHGGTAKNVVPAECTFLVEWRPIPNHPLEFVADNCSNSPHASRRATSRSTSTFSAWTPGSRHPTRQCRHPIFAPRFTDFGAERLASAPKRHGWRGWALRPSSSARDRCSPHTARESACQSKNSMTACICCARPSSVFASNCPVTDQGLFGSTVPANPSAINFSICSRAISPCQGSVLGRPAKFPPSAP